MTIVQNSLNLLPATNSLLLFKNKSDSKPDYRKRVNFCRAETITLKKSFFKDIKKRVIVKDFDKLFGALTAWFAVAGFTTGGIGLIVEAADRKAKNKSKTRDLSATTLKNDNTAKKGKETRKGGYGYIIPQTRLGKLGVAVAQITLVVSGSAGILTGLALRVPLMCAGEIVANVLSAPVTNTPLGMGLTCLGLLMIVGGRALENRPDLKLNTIALANQNGPVGKIKYVIKNMGTCLNEIRKTIKYVLSQTVNLASSDKGAKKEAQHFFKNNFLRIRSSTVTIKQNVLANGQAIAESGLKTHPYRLHVFAGIAGVSGAILIAEYLLEKIGVIKGEKARKICFNIAKSGQYANNTSAVIYGFERSAKGTPLLGVPAMFSGFIALAKIHKINEDEGKGALWLATASFFVLIAIERTIEALLAFKAGKNLKIKPMMDEFSDFAKLFEIDFSKAAAHLTKKQLDNIRKVVGGQEKAMLHIKELFSKKAGAKAAGKMAEEVEQAIRELESEKNSILNKIPEFMKASKEILTGPYKPDFNEMNLVEELEKRNFPHDFIDYVRKNLKITCKITEPQDLQNLMGSIHNKNNSYFGENYLPSLSKIINNLKEYPSWVLAPAQKAYNNFYN